MSIPHEGSCEAGAGIRTICFQSERLSVPYLGYHYLEPLLRSTVQKKDPVPTNTLHQSQNLTLVNDARTDIGPALGQQQQLWRFLSCFFSKPPTKLSALVCPS